MEQEYYWIETIAPLLGFWGTAFKFWDETKRIKEKALCKINFCIARFFNKNRIRDST